MLKRNAWGGIIFIIALLCTVISINGNTYAATQTHQSTDQSAQSEDAKVGTTKLDKSSYLMTINTNRKYNKWSLSICWLY